MSASTTSLICILALCLLFSAKPAAAFGAGNIPSFSYLEGKAFRHGDIDDVLSELAKKSGGGAGALLGAIGLGGKFGGLDIVRNATTFLYFSSQHVQKRVYLGSWLRDYSQAMDVAGLSKLSRQAILNIIMALGFLAHGYATGEFEVTEERLGVYLPVEHIDNPKDYNENKDARQVHPGLRGPVDPAELDFDDRGMKNYIANERGRWDTSAAYIRRTMLQCIDCGRRARATGSEDQLWEAYRLMGSFLHTLEDFTAHSNFCEISLVKMGHREVFCHVGDSVRIRAPNGEMVPPIVTGTFGGADFIHSVLGEGQDKLSESSAVELKKKVDDSRSRSSNSSRNLHTLFSQIPGSQGDELNREMNDVENIGRNGAGAGKNPMDMSPEELHANIWKILKFRDNVMKRIETTIEKIPGLSALIDRITEAVTKFVFEQLAAYLVPVMSTATNTLMTGSASVIHDVDQFQVFDDPRASDPTHSFLSKDHFSTILNEPAGLIAQTVVRHVVKNVVQAWDHQRTDPNQVVNDALGVLHHPYFTSNSPIQQEMAATMTKWFNEQQDKNYVLNGLTKQSVREHKNTRKGSKTETPHSSFLPTPQHLLQQAQSQVQGYANQVPGYQQFQNFSNNRRDMPQPQAQSGYASYDTAGKYNQGHHHQPSHNPYGGAAQTGGAEWGSFNQPPPSETNYGSQYGSAPSGYGSPPPGQSYGQFSYGQPQYPQHGQGGYQPPPGGYY